MTLADRPTAPLLLHLFGPLTVRVNGAPLPALHARKQVAILALLTLRHGRPMERAWLAGLLWPENTESQGLATLRRYLTGLRRALGPEAYRLHSPLASSLAIDLAGADVDVLTFDATVARGDQQSLEEAVAVYRGPLLEGWTEEWVFQERQVREQAYLKALETLAAMARGEPERAAGYLRQAVSTDPLRESAQRALMELLAGTGNYAAALAVYRELRERLHRELNADPDAATTGLFQQLRAEARAKAVQGAGFRGHGGLRGPQQPEHILQLVAPDLPTDFLPLKLLQVCPNNLPASLTPLIGRQREVETARELLQRESVRLLTLTGPGGTGKTRLSLEVATDLLNDFSDGVFFVDLAPIQDPELVAASIAQALSIPQSSSVPRWEALKNYLREKQLLLLLDNFEQVLGAAPRVGELLAVAPGLKVLGTSREPLHVCGEQEFPVPPLAVPDPCQRLPVAVLGQYGAVALFVQRVAQAQPEFALTEANATAVGEICRRLDGLPLALELAAARVKLFAPQALLARLAHPLKLLTGGARDLPARQQTLRNTVAWSYDLLEEEERKLLRRLSVFVGGFTLEAAEAVANAAEDLQTDLLDLLSSLADKSLLRPQDGSEGESRFTMLETIRWFGWERLQEAVEEEVLRDHHLEFFRSLVEGAEPELYSRERMEWWDRLEREQDNLRAALAWSLGEPGPETPRPERVEEGLRLAGAVHTFWTYRGYCNEGREWLEKALALSDPTARTVARAKALHAAGALAMGQRDVSGSRSRLEEAVALWREIGDKQGLGRSLGWLGLAYLLEGKEPLTAARTVTEESVGLLREVEDDQWGLPISIFILGCVMGTMGDLAAAQACHEESLKIFQACDDRWAASKPLLELGSLALARGEYATARSFFQESRARRWEARERWERDGTLDGLAQVAMAQGDYTQAREHFEQRVSLLRQLGLSREVIAQTAWDQLATVGNAAREQGHYQQAAVYYRESLALRQEAKNTLALAQSLEDFAGLAVRQEQWKRGARLLGAAEGICAGIPALPPAVIPEEYEAAVRGARTALGLEGFTTAWAEGRAMKLDDAVALALTEIRED
jgi:predicted ATPase/DNA-binding SARP family transcriptional activator